LIKKKAEGKKRKEDRKEKHLSCLGGGVDGNAASREGEEKNLEHQSKAISVVFINNSTKEKKKESIIPSSTHPVISSAAMDSIQTRPVLHTKLSQKAVPVVNDLKKRQKKPFRETKSLVPSPAQENRANKKNLKSDAEKDSGIKRDPEANAKYQKELKRAKRERRKARLEAGAVTIDELQTAAAAASTTVRGRRIKVSRNDAKSQDAPLVVSRRADEKWKLSQPVGGRFADVRPLFSKDEKFVECLTDTIFNILTR